AVSGAKEFMSRLQELRKELHQTPPPHVGSHSQMGSETSFCGEQSDCVLRTPGPLLSISSSPENALRSPILAL
ncbi:hypothetical protein P7K49_024671, partial [Saguinus oedipus]